MPVSLMLSVLFNLHNSYARQPLTYFREINMTQVL